jgi:ribosomal protein L37AE/L43A
MKQPKMYCPECNAEYDDFDGFGILYCEKCGYCSHASVTGDICQFCKKNIKKEQ